MGNIQNTLSGKTWQGLFRVIKGRISAECLKKSQKPTFQCLIVEDGQQAEWLEASQAVQLGDSWTLNTGECPSVENVSTLYTILMGRNGGNQLGVGQDISYTLTAADRHAIAAPEAFRLSSFGGFAEGVGTLRASGGDNGGQ